MPLLRSAIAAGLLVIGVHVLAAAAATEAAAAIDCPCIRTGSACVPDTACEARKRAERARFERWRRQYQRPPASVRADPARLPQPSIRLPPSSGSYGGRLRAAPRPTAAPAPTAAPRPSAAPAPTAAPGPTAAPAPGSQRPGPTTRARPRILETGYSHLAELGKEAGGYGLYSYAILPSDSNRAALFLGEVFKEIPSIGNTSAAPAQANIFYIPLRKDKEADFMTMLQAPGRNAEKLGAEYTKSFYDYRMARALLNHVCNPPDPSVMAVQRRLVEQVLTSSPTPRPQVPSSRCRRRSCWSISATFTSAHSASCWPRSRRRSSARTSAIRRGSAPCD